MNFLACLQATKGDLFKASILWCKDRGHKGITQRDWFWFESWQTTDLPNEVEEAVKNYFAK